MNKYEITIFFPDGKSVNMTTNPASPEGIVIRTPQNLTPSEISAVHYIKEAYTCLVHGKPVDVHFNPLMEADRETIVMCEWTRSGSLRLVSERATKKWQHASNVSEALSRLRKFTCSRFLYNTLPHKK